MRHLILFFSFVIFSITTNAQYVGIPDSNFRSFLSQNFPSAMVGNTMDTTNFQIINTTTITCDSMRILNLDGIQYFNNLQSLNCSRNYLTSLPTLPQGLVSLDCYSNLITQLPSLPPTLINLNCFANNLIALPILPNGIKNVNCSINQIDTLLPFTNQLETFNCSTNLLSTIPLFPNTLLSFNCYNNLISVIPALTNNLSSLTTSHNPIYSLPTLPNSLIYLACEQNFLSVLPTLPSNLSTIYCSNNNLLGLPTLPTNLISLYCQNDSLFVLPTLPTSLVILNCTDNFLPTLPLLHTGLKSLYCGFNSIPFLPTLPTTLQNLDYSSNPIAALPLLPAGLLHLTWNSNVTTPQLPSLPNTLLSLFVSQTPLDSLPILPNSLRYISCRNDSLAFLPTLPTSLLELDCSMNQLTTMPTIPNAVEKLLLNNNQISNISYLPVTLKIFNCSYNPSLSCLPKLPSIMLQIYVESTSITCLPNLVNALNSSFNIDTLDLCTPATGCPVAWNIAGNIHIDTSSSCYLDSLNPGNRVINLTVKLLNNLNLLDTFQVTSMGEYSFDTDNNSSFSVCLDTLNIPFQIVCPTTGVHQITVTPADSLKPNISFGIQCTGFDAGVKSIYGRFRPAVLSHVSISGGDMAQFYNVHCNTNINPGIVTTSINGPAMFVQASTNSLSPTNVNGNIITYVVPDLGAVDFNTAFNIDVMTDMNASIGTEVCIKTQITNVSNDLNNTNNIINVCFPVVNSFDPNAKYVSPKEKSEAGDLLTYTVMFQNTGNDTAYQVIIRDTLDENLDWNSFQFVNSSHLARVERVNNQLTFLFYNINLLDSFHNEPQSHGWLQFRIKLKSGLAYGTKTKNVASIYFDFNPPIVTDTAINFVGVDTTFITSVTPIVIPNAITPNNDGLNEYWHVLNIPYLNRKKIKIDRVQVTDRWGKTVFMAFNESFKWLPNQNQASDNYHYYIGFTTLSGNKLTQQGDLIIVR